MVRPGDPDENFQQPTKPDLKQLEEIPRDRYRRKLLDLHRDDQEPIVAIIRSTEGRIGRYLNYYMRDRCA